jgi:hypothetical protein
VQIRNQADFFAGLLFAGFGAFFTYFSMQYPMRSAANAGPGYFSFYLGVLLIILGAAISLASLSHKSQESQEEVGRFDFKVLLLVLGAVAAFGVLLQTLGFVLTLLSVVLISSLASHEFTWKGSLLNALVLVVLCIVVFVWALKLQFQLWPAFIS